MSNVTTTSYVDDAVGVWYNPNLLDVAIPKLLANQFGQMKSIPKGSSKTIRWGRYEELSEATVSLTEGTEPNGQQMTVTRMDATAKQYGDLVILTDVIELTVSDPVANEANRRLGEQMGRTLDTLTFDILHATTNYYAAAKGANTYTPTEITQEDIDIVVQKLMNKDTSMFAEIMPASTGYGTAPLDESYYAMTNTAVYRDVKEVDSWVPINQYPKPAARKLGERGYTDNVRWCMSSKAPSTANGDLAGTHTIYDWFVLGRDAYGVVDIASGNAESIFTPPGGAGDRLKQRSSLGWKAWHACKILNNNFMVRGYCTLSSYST